MCAKEEEQFVIKCRTQNSVQFKNLKSACCSSAEVETCILNLVPEECKAWLRERYQNGPLRKGDCKQIMDDCDKKSTFSSISTTNQPPTDYYANKPETLKQSIISHTIPQTQTTPPDKIPINDAVRDGPTNNGILVSNCVLLMFICSSFMMVNLFSRWLN